MRTTRQGPSPVRVYGGLIGLASGGYSVWRALGMMDGPMMAPAWIMGLVGALAFIHGLVLFTPIAARAAFASVSGPLMLAYATIMLAVQAWLAIAPPDTGMMGTERAWDAGMIVLALLMLASGAVMTWLARKDGSSRAAPA